jgi:hypothetical protein
MLHSGNHLILRILLNAYLGMINESINILITSINRIAIKNWYAMSDLPT